jgi:hypothetical protein
MVVKFSCFLTTYYLQPVNPVEVSRQVSHNRHRVHGVLVGAGSLWSPSHGSVPNNMFVGLAYKAKILCLNSLDSAVA